MDSNQDNKYTFIEEKIIPNKTKKVRKTLMKLLVSVCCGILFGVTAIGTMYVLFKVIPHDPEETIIEEPQEDPVAVVIPDVVSDTDKDDAGFGSAEGIRDTEPEEDHLASSPVQTISNQPVVVENRIRADIRDLTSIYKKINNMAVEVNRSIVEVSAITSEMDWFQNPYETRTSTCGFIADEDDDYYYVMADSSLASEGSELRVTFDNSVEAVGEIYDMHTVIGISCIRVAKESLPNEINEKTIPASFGESYSMIVGEPVVALGKPNGYMYSMLIGTVTGKSRVANVTDDRIDLFSTDFYHYKGCSGIIVNMDGNVIGIITDALSDSDEICTAMSISKVRPILEKLVNRTPRVFLGVVTSELTEEMKESIEQSGGIYVAKVETDSPAAKAGIRAGDVILQIGENTVFTTAGFSTYLQSLAPGTTASFKIARPSRDGEAVMNIDVMLGQTILEQQ